MNEAAKSQSMKARTTSTFYYYSLQINGTTEVDACDGFEEVENSTRLPDSLSGTDFCFISIFTSQNRARSARN
jgi:hypothetical protein